jgi:hypothetical protein
MSTETLVAAEPQQFITVGKNVQAGSMVKNSTSLTINFPTPFASVPTVVVSSFWQGATGGVSFAETISAISLDQFTVVSGNAAANYYVNWIACAG